MCPHAGIGDIADLPAIERARIEAFFRVYEDLPEARKTVELDSYADAAQARALICSAMAAYDTTEED